MTIRSAGIVLLALTLGACAHGEKSFAKFTARHSGADILPLEFVKQREPADCGAAALTSVGRFWGADVHDGAIFTHWKPANLAFGYSIGELTQASGKMGLSSSRLLEEPDYVLKLVDEGLPVIAPIAKPYERRDIFDFMLASMLSRLIVTAFLPEPPTVNHYVVVLGADAQLVYLLDPQDGYRAMARNEFLDHWSDLTLEFVPDAGANVAAFVPYYETPAPAARDSGPTAFSDELMGYDVAAVELAAGASFVRAP